MSSAYSIVIHVTNIVCKDGSFHRVSILHVMIIVYQYSKYFLSKKAT